MASKSLVWMYFDICKDERTVKCKICATVLTRGTSAKNFSTTPLWNHMQSKHLDKYSDLLKSKNKTMNPEESLDSSTSPCTSRKRSFTQATLLEAIESKKVWDSNNPKALKITKDIGIMIAMDNQPFSIVGDIGFSRLMLNMEPRYQIPNRRYFSEKVIPQLYASAKTKLLNLLTNMRNGSKVSLTTDMWSNANNDSFISLSAHCASNSFKRFSVSLAIHTFPGNHTSNAICQTLKEILLEWSLKDSDVHLVVSDNAANIINGLKLANLPRAACFIHTLQLCIVKGLSCLQAVDDIIAT